MDRGDAAVMPIKARSDVSSYGFTGNGIVVSGVSGANLTAKVTTVTAVGTGIRIHASGSVKASLSGLSIRGTGDAVNVSGGATDVSHSILSQHSAVALRADGGVLTAEGKMITGNGTAATAQTVRDDSIVQQWRLRQSHGFWLRWRDAGAGSEQQEGWQRRRRSDDLRANGWDHNSITPVDDFARRPSLTVHAYSVRRVGGAPAASAS
jgi:hypothetical protein